VRGQSGRWRAWIENGQPKKAARPALRTAVVRLSRVDLRARCASDVLADAAVVLYALDPQPACSPAAAA
jgi:hypothetical protein